MSLNICTQNFLVTIAFWNHLTPCRTQKWNETASMIVWASHVKVEHRQGLIKETRCSNAAGFLLCAEFSHRYERVSALVKMDLFTLRKANVFASLIVVNTLHYIHPWSWVPSRIHALISMNCEATLRSHLVHVKVEHRQQRLPQLGAPEHLKKPVAAMQRVFSMCRIFASRSNKAETSAQGEVSSLYSSSSFLVESVSM